MTHYYSNMKGLHDPFKIRGRIGRRSFSLWSDKGVFSKEHIDSATTLLLEETPVHGDAVLDLGCGVGVVGVFVGQQGVRVTGVDTNRRAVLLARRNYEEYGVDGKVFVSDGYEEVDGVFSHILTNPPMAAGRDVCVRFIEEAPTYLEDGGRFSLVARHKKGGKYLYTVMKDVFRSVDVLAKSGGFRVYHGQC